MNILADEQLKLFAKDLNKDDYLKVEKEFLDLYFQLREKNENRFYSKLSLNQRKKLYKYILFTYTIKNKLEGFTYEVLKDEREETKNPIIFAITHVGKFDIEIVSQAIREHSFILSGDYEHLQGRIDEHFIGLNGVFYFNEFVKSDRQKVTKEMIDLLKENGNLMYFPEGTWNLSPNLPTLPCYWGIVDIAKASNATIIPIAAEQYDKHWKISIGKNFDMSSYGEGKEEKTRAIEDLTDTLATLKWEIWETEPTTKERIDKNYWRDYKNARYAEWPYFNDEYVDRLIFKPKDVTTTKDAHAFTRELVPKPENAFLYNKSLKNDIFRD